MFPNRIDEIQKKDLDVLESIEMSNVSRRSAIGRAPFREINPHSKVVKSFNNDWSPTAKEAFKGKNDSIKIISVRFLAHVKDINNMEFDTLIDQKFNQSAGDVKDIYNLLYGYDLNNPAMQIVNQSYLDFMVGAPLPSNYLRELLKKLNICQLMEKHRGDQCIQNHPTIMENWNS